MSINSSVNYLLINWLDDYLKCAAIHLPLSLLDLWNGLPWMAPQYSVAPRTQNNTQWLPLCPRPERAQPGF